MNLTDPPRETIDPGLPSELGSIGGCPLPSENAPRGGAVLISPRGVRGEQAWRFDASVKDYGLTQVQAEILALTAKGLTNFEVAKRRGSSEGTVKVHMNRIFTKLKVRSRCEAIALYLQLNNVDPEELRRAETGHMDMKWLLATMTHEHHPKGTVLFRFGDVGDKIYYVQRGIVGLREIGVNMEPQALFGEIGVFAPEHRRTCTAVCKTHVDLFTLTYEEVRRCYFLNPQFAYYVMYLVTQRLMADRDRVSGVR